MVLPNINDSKMIAETMGRLYLKNKTIFNFFFTIYLLFFLYLFIKLL